MTPQSDWSFSLNSLILEGPVIDTVVQCWKLPSSQLPGVLATDSSQLCVSLLDALTKGGSLIQGHTRPMAAHTQRLAQPCSFRLAQL